jgi:hypothetical protein
MNHRRTLIVVSLFSSRSLTIPQHFPSLGLSLEELGMRALERLPRDRAIDGILAFNAMRYV